MPWRDSLMRRRREFLILLALLLMMGVVVRVLLPAIRGGETTWARIQQEGVLRVGLDPSFPPFEYEEEGSLVGYDVDLAQEVGRRIGLQVQFVPLGFDGLYDGLKAGKYDALISALPYDPRLTQDVAYSWVYFNAGQCLVVREDEGEITRVEDLREKKVAVEWGSAGDVEGRYLEERIGFERVPYLTPREALEALRDGEVEAAIVDAVSAYGFMGEQGGGLVVGLPVTDEPYVIAVRLDSPVLLREINFALRAMEEEGVLEGLEKKWFY
jgi:polar amino acid transport system substrate-binding protein